MSSLHQWKAPFSTALITASAALLGSDWLVSMQPIESALTPLPSSARAIWSPISPSAAAHWSPISYSKGERGGTLFAPQPPVSSPHLVGCLVPPMIINQRHWQHRLSITPSGIIDLCVPSSTVLSSALGQHFSQAVAYWSPPDTVLRSLYW